MAEQVWLDGALVPAAEARVSVFDHGLTVGDGVFETLRASGPEPFAARLHLARLRRSAEGLGLVVPFDDDDLRAAMRHVLASHEDAAPRMRVRITVTGGPAPLGSDRGEAPATVVVAAAPLADSPESTAVCVVPWPRNERGPMAGIKTTSYAENVVALAHAKARGCSEALFANTAGMLCEGTGSNVFCVFGGEVVTPPLSAGCLAGVTRSLVLRLTAATEDDIPMARFAEADEVFLTSTGRYVQAVHRVDHRELAPGPVTAAARAAFEAFAAQHPDP